MAKTKVKKEKADDSNNEKQFCEFCNREFNSLAALRYHKSVCVFNPDSSRFSTTCCFCNLHIEHPTVAAILEHLKLKHINETPPRYVNGKFVTKGKRQRSKATLAPAKKLPVIKVTECIPSIYTSPPAYTVSDHSSDHSILFHHNQQSVKLHTSCAVQLNNDSYAIHTEGQVISSCLCSRQNSILLAVSTIPFNEELSVYKRSTQQTCSSSEGYVDGLLSFYSIQDSSFTFLFHICHPRSYAVSMEWIEPDKAHSLSIHGVLCCLFSDGSIQFITVPQVTFDQPSTLSIEPLISFSLPVRATAFRFHPLYSNLLYIGFDDGSVRTIHIEESDEHLHFHVIGVLRSQLSWFESTPIRSIACSESNPYELVVCDERGCMFVWNTRHSTVPVFTGTNTDMIENAFVPKGVNNEQFLVCGGNAIRWIHGKGEELISGKALIEFGNSIQSCFFIEEGNRVVFATESGDVYHCSLSSLSGGESISCKGLPFGHIRYEKEGKEAEVKISTYKKDAKKQNAEGLLTCSCGCVDMCNDVIIGYGSLGGLFVIARICYVCCQQDSE